MNTRVHIIAEAGTNHNGCVETAERLVDAAAQAGADSVKFQMIYPEGLYLPRLRQNGQLVDNPVYAQRQAGMLSDDDYRRLAGHAAQRGIPWSASIFDARGLKLLVELGGPYIKIASCDLNNSRLLSMAAETGRRVVLSTGMSSLGDVERAVHDLLRNGPLDVVLMHCVSQYPCPTERMNLSFITVLQSAFGLPVGLSDHTEDHLAAAAAVALGATWIEKHFTLDRSSPGFDHAYALEPADLARFVRAVRAVEAACTRSVVKVGPEESNVRVRARRALYASHELAAGQMLSATDVLVVRPEGPLAPNDLDGLLGRPLRRAVGQYEPLTADMV